MPLLEKFGVAWYADGTTYEACISDSDEEMGNTKRADAVDMSDLEAALQGLTFDEHNAKPVYEQPTTLLTVGLPTSSGGPVSASPSPSS